MNVYLFDASEHVDWDQHEAWTVIAPSVDEGWQLILAGE